MGDMADYHLDMIGDYDNDYDCLIERECGYCGKKRLNWVTTKEGKWRLSDRNGKIHTCDKYKTGKKK